ncbi:MAG: hypothetical protein RSG96_08820, partial [Clostridia bacterium]
MQATWDLSVYYKGFDDPAFTRDIQSIKELAEHGAEQFKASKSTQEALESIITQTERLSDLLDLAYGYVQLTLSTEAENPTALRWADELSGLMVGVQLFGSQCVRYVGAVEALEDEIAKSELLQKNAFALREYAERAA